MPAPRTEPAPRPPGGSRSARSAPSMPARRPGSWDDGAMALEGEVAGVPPAPVGAGAPDALLGESRWPPVAGVALFMLLNVVVRLWLPHEGVAHLPWLGPALEAVLVVVLLTSDPSGAAERRRMRRLALTLVGLLVAAAL